MSDRYKFNLNLSLSCHLYILSEIFYWKPFEGLMGGLSQRAPEGSTWDLVLQLEALNEPSV